MSIEFKRITLITHEFVLFVLVERLQHIQGF